MVHYYKAKLADEKLRLIDFHGKFKYIDGQYL